jgi:glycine cleavage system regulatory protein
MDKRKKIDAILAEMKKEKTSSDGNGAAVALRPPLRRQRSPPSVLDNTTDIFDSVGKISAPAMGLSQRSSMFPTSEPDYAPQTGMENRLVIQESYLSLLVKDVTDTRNKIVSHAQSVGGYMVNSNTNNPEESPTATVIVRVPATKLEETLSVYRAMGIKVVNENLTGRDVTDQYVDIDTRIEQLEKTKAKLEELLDRATLIADITNLTQQILSYQSQIDSYIGQQEALKKNADLTKLTVYLSTDEIALPYTPSETWRPGVIFKLAVRSLVGSLRDLGEFIIWAGVYSVIWVPALLIFWYVRRRMNSNKKVESTSYKN